MSVNLYLTFETPYNPAEAGLTVEAWPASLFAHSPVGNPGAYPPAPSPTATTTTDSSGNCELTGLTAGTDYYASIIDVNNKPWFLFCPAAYLGNLGTSRRRLSINQGPVPAPPPFVPYASLTGAGELTTPGALTQDGGFTVSPPATPSTDPIDLNQTGTGSYIRIDGSTGAITINGQTASSSIFVDADASIGISAGAGILVEADGVAGVTIATPSGGGGPILLQTNGSGVDIDIESAGDVDISASGNVSVAAALGHLGFYGVTGITQPTVTGSRGGNAALHSLLSALANLGLIVDSSSL